MLRRKPPGKLLPGAHAVDRQYRMIRALAGQGFPVARAYALCLDEAVISTQFYAMEMVEGRIFWNPAFPDVPREEHPAYFDAMNDTIARLHQIDPNAAGLGGYGKPGNYFARQIARWSGQYRADEQAGRVPAMDRLVEWLPENIPTDEPQARIIHGDFRCDNMIFHPAEPKVVAVLDWELSTLGHPLADFSYHLMMFRMPDALGRYRPPRFLHDLQPLPPRRHRPRHQGPAAPRHRRLRPRHRDDPAARAACRARLGPGGEGRRLEAVQAHFLPLGSSP